MKKQDPVNQEIYRIGDKVLNALRLSDDEIEKIAGSPQLFDSIRAAMESGQVQHEPQRSIDGWRFLKGLSLQKSMAAFGVFVLLTVGLLIFLSKEYYSPSSIAVSIQQEIEPVEIPQLESAILDPTEFQKPYEYIGRNDRETNRAMRARAGKKTLREKAEEVGEFVAVTYAGDLEESEANGQVVRVRLPRSSLFAMGINIPAGNEAETFKTDLLIGEDGVMRAIRLIN